MTGTDRENQALLIAAMLDARAAVGVPGLDREMIFALSVGIEGMPDEPVWAQRLRVEASETAGDPLQIGALPPGGFALVPIGDGLSPEEIYDWAAVFCLSDGRKEVRSFPDLGALQRHLGETVAEG